MAPIPDPSASSAQVRYYITQILIAKYHLEHTSAEQTARAWKIGRGAELQDASFEYLQQLLGVEVGFCLSKSILDDRDEAWVRSIIGRFLYCKLFHDLTIRTRCQVLITIFPQVCSCYQPRGFLSI